MLALSVSLARGSCSLVFSLAWGMSVVVVVVNAIVLVVAAFASCCV